MVRVHEIRQEKSMGKHIEIGIIGAGVGGSVASIRLASQLRKVANDMGRLPVRVTLIEQNKDICEGPPWCHLHAGGMLYTGMKDYEARSILHHSCMFARMFNSTNVPGGTRPSAIQHRPTVVSIRQDVTGPGLTGDELVRKCQKVQGWYKDWVKEYGCDPLGPPDQYFSYIDYETLVRLKESADEEEGGTTLQSFHDDMSLLSFTEPVDSTIAPGTSSHIHPCHLPYLKTFAKWIVDPNLVKYPVVCVQEEGIDLNIARLQLKEWMEIHDIQLRCNTLVSNIERDSKSWIVHVKPTTVSHSQINQVEETLPVEETLAFDFIVNSAGSCSFKLSSMMANAILHTAGDEMNQMRSKFSSFAEEKKDDEQVDETYRLLEMKASYIVKVPINDSSSLSQSSSSSCLMPSCLPIPEIVFLGLRGTEKGMIQVSPYDPFSNSQITVPSKHGSIPKKESMTNFKCFHIHSMTKNCTLFQGGLIRDENEPKFPTALKKIIDLPRWTQDHIEARKRSIVALHEASKFLIPLKHPDATVGGDPLWGIQQIPCSDPEKRVGGVSTCISVPIRTQLSNMNRNDIQYKSGFPLSMTPNHVDGSVESTKNRNDCKDLKLDNGRVSLQIPGFAAIEIVKGISAVAAAEKLCQIVVDEIS